MSDVDPRASFFPKRKVRAELDDWRPLKSSKGEKRARIDFIIPLIDDNREGELPSWAFHTIAAMESEASAETEGKLSTTLEGVTLEFWATPKSERRSQMCTAATLGGFTVKRVARDKQEFLALCFNTAVKVDKDFVGWLYEYLGMTLWVEFTATDAALEPPKPAKNADLFDGKAAAAGSDGDDEPAHAEGITISDEDLEENIREQLADLDSDRDGDGDSLLVKPEGATEEQFDRVLKAVKLELEGTREVENAAEAAGLEGAEEIQRPAGFDPTKKGARKRKARSGEMVN